MTVVYSGWQLLLQHRKGVVGMGMMTLRGYGQMSLSRCSGGRQVITVVPKLQKTTPCMWSGACCLQTWGRCGFVGPCSVLPMLVPGHVVGKQSCRRLLSDFSFFSSSTTCHYHQLAIFFLSYFFLFFREGRKYLARRRQKNIFSKLSNPWCKHFSPRQLTMRLSVRIHKFL